MKLLLHIILTLGFMLPLGALASLDCEFTIYGAPFLSTTTDLTDVLEVGDYTEARYFGGQGGGRAPNKVLDLKEGERFAFELNESETAGNIEIRVKEDMSAIALNHRAEIGNKSPGSCVITN